MNIWIYIALIAIGIIIGIIAGCYIQYSLLKNNIGDDYEINRPKIKGENNILDIKQKNDVEKKPNKKKFKLFRREKNV